MLILYDFECSNKHRQEVLVARDTPSIPCNVCQEVASRMITPIRFKCDGTDPGFPDAYDKWGRDHEKRGGDSEQTLDENHSK